MMETPWVKATASGGDGGNCVEQRHFRGMIEVRDTKAGGRGPTLRFTAAEFAAWLDGAKRGDLDHLR